MCGIAGYFDPQETLEDRQSILKRMCGAIVHRGPDDEGFHLDGPVGLGMRRLSIIDLKNGHQPVTNETSSVWAVFNGEIYNYKPLREALQKKGHTFKSTSDTEVIVHQYETEGDACVQQFNGMFGIAIWDHREQKLILTRERLGIKPLYYYSDGTRLFFASEIKALLASGQVPQELDVTSVWDYLTLRYVPQPKTIWKNVYKLLPGHTLTVTRENPKPVIHRYWDIPYTPVPRPKRFTDYAYEFSNLFLDAVKIHLNADVPVGVLLSGGLDSSAVAAAIKEVHTAPLNSFSVAFKDSPQTNELPYARQVAKHVGMKHHEILIGQEEFLDFLPKLTHFTDEPLADLACVPLYYVSRLAHDSVKVVMSGEGSDEILGGYDFDRVLERWDSLNVLGPVSRWWLNHRLKTNPPRMTDLFSTAEKRALFQAPPAAADTVDAIRAVMQRVSGQEPLHQVLYQYSQSWLVDDLLMKADRMTMANSIELRVPFLDHRLVEWLAKIPASTKVGKDEKGRYTTKRLLRAFAASRLPKEILDRPKQGFPVPVAEWLTGPLKSWATDLLGAADARIKRLFVPQEVARLLAQGTAATSSTRDQHRLWQLLILEIWMREWSA